MSGHDDLMPAEAERLDILAEEAAEVIQVVCKILRHGYDSKAPSRQDGPTNRELLVAELGDLLAAVYLLTSRNDISDAQVSAARDAKLSRIGPFLHHQTVKPNGIAPGPERAKTWDTWEELQLHPAVVSFCERVWLQWGSGMKRLNPAQAMMEHCSELEHDAENARQETGTFLSRLAAVIGCEHTIESVVQSVTAMVGKLRSTAHPRLDVVEGAWAHALSGDPNGRELSPDSDFNLDEPGHSAVRLRGHIGVDMGEFRYQLKRCKDALVEYERIPAGRFAAAMISTTIAEAEQAIEAPCDLVSLLAALRGLRGVKG